MIKVTILTGAFQAFEGAEWLVLKGLQVIKAVGHFQGNEKPRRTR